MATKSNAKLDLVLVEKTIAIKNAIELTDQIEYG